MDIDFHYYATYVAAVVAGYNTTDATSIAHAAQYIDDATPIRQIKTADIETIATVLPTLSGDPHEETAVGSANDWNPNKIARHRRMWTAFHFLPGNIGPHYAVPYKGPQSDSSVYGAWNYNDELAQLQFQSMCLPGSPLAVAMVEDTLRNHSHDLKMIGIRMHVLIDTFAHQHFCGSAAWHVNDVHNDGQYYDRNGKIINIEVGFFDKTSGSGNYNSLNFTGHGRMGHLPDYPWITFLYQPRWSDKTITRDNPTQYSRAFREMAHALYCIRTGTEYSYGLSDDALLSRLGVSGAVFATVDEIIRLRPKGESVGERTAYILSDWTDERCENWRERLNGQRFEHALLKAAPPDYQEAQYQEEAEALLDKSQSISGSAYAAWHGAALQHLDFVDTYLGEHKLGRLLGTVPFVGAAELKHILDKTCFIAPRMNEKEAVVEVENDSRESGTPIQLYDRKHATPEVHWTPKYAGKNDDGDDLFTFHNARIGKYLGVKDGFARSSDKPYSFRLSMSSTNIGAGRPKQPRHLSIWVNDDHVLKLEDNQFGDSTKLQVWEPDPNNPHFNDWLIQAV